MKGAFAAILYYSPWKTSAPWNLYGAKMQFSWMYLFAAWDSGAYHELAANWYPSSLNPLWAYFPLYPACIRLFGFLGLDLWLGAFLVANVAGFLSILMFHKVARAYLAEADSYSATALYFLLPYVFVFTTVSYTESLFLLLSLMTWYAHIKGRDVRSTVFASLTTLTRAYGLLMLIPMGYNFLKNREFRRLSVLVLPIATFLGWISYGFLRTGNALASFAAQSYWTSPTALQIRDSLSSFFMTGDLGVFQLVERFEVVMIVGFVTIVFIAWLCIRTWRIDKSLTVYSTTFLLAMSLVVGIYIQNFISLSRYLSLIFPVGLSLTTSRKWLLYSAIVLLSLLDLTAWWMFLFTQSFH
ncbi:MAG TPA: mannosyltransferase family protein [Candidatus Dormibacteraeota bacterium]|nr:mannosyltransferase family protein [Candidatus Dormibacteraeota bacterium]